MKAIIIALLVIFFSINTKHLDRINITPKEIDTNTCVAHDTTVQLFVEKNAKFQDGDLLSFRKYVMNKIVMPPEANINRYQGRATIKFIVDWDGQVKNVVVYKSSGYKVLDDEAIRVVRLSPVWISAKNNTVCVPQQFILPIDFITLGVINRQY
jgi:TonB family protein